MQSLNSKPTEKCFDAFVHRLQADIDFLEHRLELLQKQRIPNKVTIGIYQELLSSRRLTLKQLEN